MYAVLVINIEAPLEGTFHYFVPADLETSLQVGHLVEVDFGRRLAQGIVIDFDTEAPVEGVKPVIALVDATPVVRPVQIALAQWLSETYLTSLNACLRLLLPPGLTRWADVTVALSYDYVNKDFDGVRLTETQRQILDILRAKGDRRGRQLRRALPKGSSWQNAVNQLERRGIVKKATILDPPRVRPKRVRTAELIGRPRDIATAALALGRTSKQADVLWHLYESRDPLPALSTVREATGATQAHIDGLIAAGLLRLTPATTLVLPAGAGPAGVDLPAPLNDLDRDQVAAWEAAGQAQLLAQPAALSLSQSLKATLPHIYERRGGGTYYAILQLLAAAAMPVNISDIYRQTGATISHLRRLVKQDLIRLGSEEVWRDPLADRDFAPADPPRLTTDQARVWGRIKIALLDLEPDELPPPIPGAPTSLPPADLFGQAPAPIPSAPTPLPPTAEVAAPFLLHGVTGSGKTEIYMRAIDLALDRGQQALVLVPEIALTPQTVRRFSARFPGQVAVLHSRLSDGERYDTWRRARAGLIDILIGPRSALFAPLPQVGVIVLDEEHDPSYKQTPPVPPPYYHTRETAEALGKLCGAIVILGSATPDLVTYHRARAGRYSLLELPRRVMGHRQRVESQAERLQVQSVYAQAPDDPEEALTIPLPPVQVVDLRQELRAGNRSIFSRTLQVALDETLDRGEQAILFLNRRGTATFVICRDCGHVLRCPRCDTPLTFHRPRWQLTCHHCGHREQPHETCPKCGSHRIKHFGLGTEKLEAEVQRRWPAARIVRWDRDTTAGRDKHEALLANFVNQEADILVGTQMIAKGLDLPLVTLVGVISADVSLGLPDYRTGERTFQILSQVAGRAGRGLLGGRVIIQTYQPDHYAIRAAADHDFVSFYLEEIRFRTQHNLPPFRRLARLVYADASNQRAQEAAAAVAAALRSHVREKALGATEILGPTPPFFNRIDNRYRWQIIVRSPDPTRLLADFPVPPRWVVDVDPVSTL